MTEKLAKAYEAAAEAFAALAIEIRATGAPAAPSATPTPQLFQDTPQGRSAQGGCPIHDVPWVIRPAGISSKTNKPYAAFWKCDEQNDDGTYCREKPTRSWQDAHPIPA